MKRWDGRGELLQCGVDVRPFFVPMHEQPVFRMIGLFGGERHPVAEELSRKGVSVFEFKPAGVGRACMISKSAARVAGRWRGKRDKSLCTMRAS